MNSDKINYIDDKEEKQFDAWKASMPWQRDNTDIQEDNEECKVSAKGKCPECGVVWELGFNTREKYEYQERYCDYCVKKQEQKEAEKKDEERRLRKEQRIKDRKGQFSIIAPPRYQAVRFSERTEEDEINTFCTILYGGFGTGKTWRAYKVAYDMYTELYIEEFKHVTEIGIMNEIKAGFVDNSFDSRVSYFKEVDLLIVDEMGKNNDSDFNKAQIFEILNYRYDWEKKTILICNCEEKKELYDILSPAILDRFRERIVKMDGKSKRYTK